MLDRYDDLMLGIGRCVLNVYKYLKVDKKILVLF